MMKKFTALLTAFALFIAPVAEAAHFQFGNLVQRNLVVAAGSGGGVTALVPTSPQYVFVDGSTTHIVRMPDATTMPAGLWFMVSNRSSSTVTIQDAAFGVIGSLLPSGWAIFAATDVSLAAGTWGSQISTGGGFDIAGLPTASNIVSGDFIPFYDVSLGLNSKIDFSTMINSVLGVLPLANGRFLVGNAGGVATAVAPSGDVTFDNAGVFGITAGAISDGHVNAAAAIARSKLAAGTANHVVINDGAGAFSSEPLLAFSRGGTASNAANSTDLFNQLDPLTTKGDLIVHDGTNTVRVGVGANGSILSADSLVTEGVRWIPAPTPSVGNIDLANSVFGILPVANGGTASSNSTTAFNTLDPLTTKGDLIAHNGTDSVRVGVGTNGSVLSADSAAAEGVRWIAAASGVGNIDLANSVFGILPVANGGTNSSNSTVAFNTLSPLTTKGDLIVHNGTDAIRIGVGASGSILSADPGTAEGIRWVTPSSGGSGSIDLANSVFGVLPIANGGTGQTTATAAFNALDPLTTKGDLIVHNGTDSIRIGVGADGSVLSSNSASTAGVEWIPGGTGDVVGPASAFDNSVVRFDGITGKLIQVATASVDDSGNMTATSFIGPLTGNATSSTALAANPADCAAGTKAISIAANGDLTCSAVDLTADVSSVLPVVNGGTGQSSYTDGQILIGNTVGNTLTKTTLTQGSGITITNGNGSITISSSGGSGSTDLANSVFGVLPIANGGTGQSTTTAAFNALDPLTTKGDLIVHNGTDSIRIGVGSDGSVLSADSTVAAGVKWTTPASGFTPDTADAKTATGCGTFTVPAGVTKLMIKAAAGGGSGGTGNSSGGGGGGAGGSFLWEDNFPVFPSQQIRYCVGAGGAAVGAGQNIQGLVGQNTVVGPWVLRGGNGGCRASDCPAAFGNSGGGATVAAGGQDPIDFDYTVQTFVAVASFQGFFNGGNGGSTRGGGGAGASENGGNGGDGVTAGQLGTGGDGVDFLDPVSSVTTIYGCGGGGGDWNVAVGTNRGCNTAGSGHISGTAGSGTANTGSGGGGAGDGTSGAGGSGLVTFYYDAP